MLSAESPGLLSFAPGVAEIVAGSPYKVVITGGSGWIGQAVLEMLDGVWGEDLPTHVEVFGSYERALPLRSGRSVPCRKLADLSQWRGGPSLLVHCAFLTKDRLQDQTVADFVMVNQHISDRVLDFVSHADLRGIFTPSSGAVYKKGSHILDDDREKNAYGAMKIADEKLFTEITRSKKIPLCMPRLFNLSGPFINKHEIYALASMINAVLRGEAIKIRAAHNVVRSYIYVADLVNLAFAMMLRPGKVDIPVFDTTGEEKIELGELARSILKIMAQGTGVIERPQIVEGQDDIYVGDGSALFRAMKEHGLLMTPISQQILNTAVYLHHSSVA